MYSFFKKSVSASELASVMWEGVRDWPAKYGTDLKEDFDGAFERSIEEVYDEVVYFLAFATDYAFWSQLENKSQIRSAVSGVFIAHVRQFAQEHHCSPIPAGDWLGDGLIWIPSGTTDIGSSLANLRSRFDLYGQSLSRRHDRSAGERAAHLLAAWCGTLDSAFILYATSLFLGKWKSVKEMVGSFKIKPDFGDKIQDLAGSAIVSGFRNIALHNACAPTAKTSDEKILEIYSKVTEAFNMAAEERGERIPAVFLNRIVMKFLQLYEMRFEKGEKPGLDEAIAEKFFCDHLKYEVEKYLAEGLRPDYKRELPLF